MLPSHWGPSVNGGVEAHESYEENAYKELSEELGIRDITLTFVGNFYFDGENGQKLFSGIFTGQFDGEISELTLEPNEVDEVKWVGAAELVTQINNGKPFVGIMRAVLNAIGLPTPPHTIEYAHIVDEDNKLLCYKPRHQLAKGDRIFTTSIWIENGKGSVLSQQRADTKTWPNLWDAAAGGMVASDETPQSSAEREAAEEIGLDGISLTHEATTEIMTEGNPIICVCHWFRGISNQAAEKFRLQPEEVQKVVWVPKHDLFDEVKKHPEKYLPSAQYWQGVFGDS